MGVDTIVTIWQTIDTLTSDNQTMTEQEVAEIFEGNHGRMREFSAAMMSLTILREIGLAPNLTVELSYALALEAVLSILKEEYEGISEQFGKWSDHALNFKAFAERVNKRLGKARY